MEELKHVLTRLQIGDSMSPEEVQVMLSEADVNGDGQIDYNGKTSQVFSCLRGVRQSEAQTSILSFRDELEN